MAVLIILASITAIGVGDVAAILALALFAIPPLLTNTFAGIDGVDDEVRDAARGMGMGGAAVLWRVELPLAVPLLAAGVQPAGHRAGGGHRLARGRGRMPAGWAATWWMVLRCRTPR